MITDDIAKAFPEINVPNVGNYYSEHIAKWKQIYENHPDWSEVQKTGIYKSGKRQMNRLNVAKVLSDLFASLTFSEQVEITCGNAGYDKYIAGMLNANGFWKNIPGFISIACALGGGAVKVYADNGVPCIEYVHADRFFPIAWNGKDIVGAVIESKTQRKGIYYTFFEKHEPGRVTYKLYASKSSDTLGNEVPVAELYPELPDVVDYGESVPMFVYFKPDVSNNAEYDVPLGMSVYANAIDTLHGIDTTYDSFCREITLGKKRIIVPAETLTSYYDTKTEQWIRAYDTDDEVYVVFNSEDKENARIEDNTMELRIQQHVDALNAHLNVLCLQVGLSPGSLSFDKVEGLKTATEVMSEESRTQRTVKGDKNLLTEALEELVHALVAVGRYLGMLPQIEYTVTVSWQDNVITDDNTLIDNTIKLYSAGLLDPITAIMRANKVDEKTAQEIYEEIKKAQNVEDVDMFGS